MILKNNKNLLISYNARVIFFPYINNQFKAKLPKCARIGELLSQ